MASVFFVTLLKLRAAINISRTTNSKTFRKVRIFIEVNMVVSPLMKRFYGTDEINNIASVNTSEDK